MNVSCGSGQGNAHVAPVRYLPAAASLFGRTNAKHDATLQKEKYAQLGTPDVRNVLFQSTEELKNQLRALARRAGCPAGRPPAGPPASFLVPHRSGTAEGTTSALCGDPAAGGRLGGAPAPAPPRLGSAGRPLRRGPDHHRPYRRRAAEHRAPAIAHLRARSPSGERGHLPGRR